MGDTYTKYDLFKLYVLNDVFSGNISRPWHFTKTYIKNKMGKTPFSLLMESSNMCNLTCQTCPTPRDLIGRPRIAMSLEDFEKIIANSKDHIYRVIFHWTNEPLTNKNLHLMVKHAKDNNLFTEFSTNGLLLNKRNAERLLDAGLDKIEISIDGGSRKSYEELRGADGFDLLVENTREFVRLKKEKGKKTLVEIQFIATRYNQDEIDKIKEIVKDIGADKLFIKTFGLNGDFYSDKERKRLMEKYLPTKEGVKKRYSDDFVIDPKCNFIKNTVSVTVDGNVSICCLDFRNHYKLGNLKETSLLEVVNNERTKEVFSKSHHRQLPICKFCTPVE